MKSILGKQVKTFVFISVRLPLTVIATFLMSMFLLLCLKTKRKFSSKLLPLYSFIYLFKQLLCTTNLHFIPKL